MSEEIEQHSLGETVGLILGLYAFSLIVSIIYLFVVLIVKNPPG